MLASRSGLPRRPNSAFFRGHDIGCRTLKGEQRILTRKSTRQTDQPDSDRIKDPEEWTTGAEPMTGAQASYLNTLASEAGEEVESDLTKAEASKRIDDLQDKTGRGRGQTR